MACEFHVTNGTLPQDELNLYLARAVELYGREPRRITLNLDGEYVDVDYDFGAQPFERIRRITGYLVGTLDRFNNGKRAEENDRIKHGLQAS
ncbi:MAG: hypothetical protein GX653_08675 [Clostridiales bacterium]|nr:hypothetical protein [Clostridiales bacterium]